MIPNPTLIKTLLAGSLVISSIGIAAVAGLTGGNDTIERHTEVVSELTGSLEPVKVENTVVNTEQQQQQSNSGGSGTYGAPKCGVYVVEKPEWYGSWGEVKGRLGTYKVKNNYEGNNTIYSKFEKTCLDFYNRGYRKRIYIYYDGNKKAWVYDDYLQGQDWGHVLGASGRYPDYSSFKE